MHADAGEREGAGGKGGQGAGVQGGSPSSAGGREDRQDRATEGGGEIVIPEGLEELERPSTRRGTSPNLKGLVTCFRVVGSLSIGQS